MKKIGLLGGTFNPIHNGHLQLAEGALKLFKLDLVYFIPTGESYHKEVQYIPRDEDRLKMLELAIEDNPKLMIAKCDINRNGPTYTTDTIKDMQNLEPNAEFYWVMGTDSFVDILNWKDLDEIRKSVTFLVALRHGDSKRFVSNFRETLPFHVNEKVILFEWPIQNISSNEIRNNMMNKKYLPKSVYKYIMSKGLY
ncbi:MAG: nicotinate-nucleotide adenylyltransferase [Firmicutes bacterium]|nr:nicotinate-nucleotide adenylyltransferase [Bacillota bacterium]